MQQEPTQQDINELIISQLSAKESYFLVYAKSVESIIPPQISDPIVLVFKDDDSITMKSLALKYNALVKGTNREEVINFEMQHKLLLSDDLTVGGLKSKLRRKDISGVVMYADSNLDQCAAVSYFEDEKEFYMGKVDIPYRIKSADYFNYFYVDAGTTVELVYEQICKNIQRDMGKKVQAGQLVLTFKRSEEEKEEVFEVHDKNLLELTKNDEISVSVKGVQLGYVNNDVKNHLILKCEGYQPKNMQYKVFKGKKIIDILKMIDQNKDWSDFGLLISGFVLANQDIVENTKKVADLFEPCQGVVNHIEGVVLTEIQAFEKIKGTMGSLEKVDLESIVEKDTKNTEYRQKCEDEILKRAQTSKKQEFKNTNNVKPIFLYTSELKVRGSKVQKISSIYRIMNELLRTQSFTKTPYKEDKDIWQYRFMHQLLEQLQKLECCKEERLFRGVSYIPDHKVGEKILYKQFNSTSINEGTAKCFARQALFEIIESYSGREIYEYSFFKTEREVLFPPYVEFQVVWVGEIVNEKMKGKKIKHIKMKEVKRKPLEESGVNFVIWVDDKTIEGRAIWNQLQKIRRTTIMVQVLSTQELENWLERHKKTILDTSTSISMITNMTRIEGQARNEYAGVDAVKVLRKYLPKSKVENVFLYVGNKKMAVDKLDKNGIGECETIKISSAPSRLKQFLNNEGIT